MRRYGALLTLAVLLAGCGGGSESKYGTAKAVAAAFDCSGFKQQSAELYAADAGTCVFGDATQTVQWFKDSDSMQQWLASPDFGTVTLHGENWAIECDTKPDCTAIQAKLGGTVS
jgi:hypothetical protein